MENILQDWARGTNKNLTLQSVPRIYKIKYTI